MKKLHILDTFNINGGFQSLNEKSLFETWHNPNPTPREKAHIIDGPFIFKDYRDIKIA